MTTNEIRSFEKKYKELSDKDLAKEFVNRDKQILRLWRDTPDDLSDEHMILKDIIIERFVKKCDIGLVWNDDAQNWVSPKWERISPISRTVIDYWIES